MNAEEYNNLMVMLTQIRDRMPVRDTPRQLPPALIPGHQHKASCHGSAGEMSCNRNPVPVGTPGPRKGSETAADKRQALAIFRAVLDDWIRGAKENHEALGHRRENRGEECWRTFHAQDIRNMVNDAARELGLEEFPPPEAPEEDA